MIMVVTEILDIRFRLKTGVSVAEFFFVIVWRGRREERTRGMQIAVRDPA
jgi:hypothetical protein